MRIFSRTTDVPPPSDATDQQPTQQQSARPSTSTASSLPAQFEGLASSARSPMSSTSTLPGKLASAASSLRTLVPSVSSSTSQLDGPKAPGSVSAKWNHLRWKLDSKLTPLGPHPLDGRGKVVPLSVKSRLAAAGKVVWPPREAWVRWNLRKLSSDEQREFARLGEAYANEASRATMEPLGKVTFLVRALRHGRPTEARAASALGEIADALMQMKPTYYDRETLRALHRDLSRCTQKFSSPEARAKRIDALAKMDALASRHPTFF